MESYLSEGILGVVHNEAKFFYHQIAAGVLRRSVFGPLLYIPPTAGIEMATFADDTAITVVSESQHIVIYSLQQAINSVDKWTQQWKIKLHPQKTIMYVYEVPLLYRSKVG